MSPTLTAALVFEALILLAVFAWVHALELHAQRRRIYKTISSERIRDGMTSDQYSVVDVHTCLISLDNNQGITAVSGAILYFWRLPMKCRIVRVGVCAAIVNPGVSDCRIDLQADGLSMLQTPIQLVGRPAAQYQDGVIAVGALPRDTLIKPIVSAFVSDGDIAAGVMVQIDYVRVS